MGKHNLWMKYGMPVTLYFSEDKPEADTCLAEFLNCKLLEMKQKILVKKYYY